jgi:lipopolysaccharide export system permease protein
VSGLIVFRYLSREVLITMSAVTATLLVIIMSGRFIKFLVQATQGIIDPSVLLWIMAFKIPGFLQMILPLGLFLGFLLAYGRLYMDSEMTVLAATGMSQQRLMLYSLAPALLVALLVGWLTMGLTPKGVEAVERILNEQDTLTEFDTLEAGRFQKMRRSERVTYVLGLSQDRTQLSGVFISEKRRSADGAQDRGITVLVADSGRQEIQPDGSRYLILENGYRYDGTPGSADYRVTRYDAHGVLLPKASVSAEITDREAIPTRELLGSQELQHQVELQWRISLPLLVFVITLLAVPLSRVNPRQGRFLKLLPAIFLYMTYLSLLIAARGALMKGRLPVELGLWPVHGLFLLVGLLLLYWEPLQLRWKAGRDVQGVAHGQA